MKTYHYKKLESNISNKNTNIEFLKIVAAIMVIFSHSYPLTGNPNDPLQRIGYVSGGTLAVSFFFFLSGLYLTKSISRCENDFVFFVRRCNRIFPALAIIVFCSAFILGPLCTSYSTPLYLKKSEVYYYLFNIILIPIHNLPGVFINAPYKPTVNGALWTLPIEFGCYMLLILCNQIYRKHRRKRILMCLIIIIIGCCLLFDIVIDIYFPQFIFIKSAILPVLFFLEGAIFYLLQKKILLNYCVSFGFIIGLIFGSFFPSYEIVLLLLFPYILVTFVFGIKPIQLFEKIFGASKRGKFDISYEMYLLGFPIQQILICCYPKINEPLKLFVIASFIDIILAFVVHNFVEIVMSKATSIKKKKGW